MLNLVRSPTPPKASNTNIEDTVQFLNTSFLSPQTSRPSTSSSKSSVSELATPPTSSPPSSPSEADAICRKAIKQLRFVSQPSFIESDVEGDVLQRSKRLKSLLPSRIRHPTKSILKPSDALLPYDSSDEDPSTALLSSRSFTSFATMLESVIQQLAGGQRSSKIDAYLTTTNAIKSSDPGLDMAALESKIPLLEDFIRRDIIIISPDTRALDVKLIVQAVKTIGAILCGMNPVPHRFSNDFLGYLVDRSIYIISTPGIPKELTLAHLHLLNQRPLHVRCMTAERVSKIIIALGTIQERVSGNGVVASRFVTYGLFIRRQTESLLSHIPHWIPQIFHGMLSSVKDIRERAISCGLAAGVALGDTKQVSGFVQTVLANQTGEGQTYFDYLELRLQELLASKEDCSVAPQIWSVVVGLLRNKQYGVENWQRLVQWFRILQNCFNSSDSHLNGQAWVAWRQLIYAVLPDMSTKPAIIRALRGPIISQLSRRSSKAGLDRIKLEALSTYYLLLYQTLSPEASPDQLDLYFKEFVVIVVQEVTKKNPACADVLCQIVTCLFEKTGNNIWSREKATKANSLPVEMEELPVLGASWTRKRLGVALSVFETLTNGAKGLTPAHVKLWDAIMRSVSAAGVKEITTSTELRQAVAEITNSLQRICSNVSKKERKSATSPDTFHMPFLLLVQSALLRVGAIHFTDRNLVKVSNGLYEAATTPSRIKPVRNTSVTTAFSSIFEALHDCLPYTNATNDLHSQMSDILNICVGVKTAFRGKLLLLQECAQVFSKALPSTKSNGMWTAVTETTAKIVECRGPGTPAENLNRLQHDYSTATSILLAGLQYIDSDSRSYGRGLLKRIIRASVEETRTFDIVLDVVRALSSSLASNPHHAYAVSIYIIATLNKLSSGVTTKHRDEDYKATDRAATSKVLTIYTEGGAVMAQALRSLYDNKDLNSNALEISIGALRELLKYHDSNTRNFLQSLGQGLVLWAVDVKGVVFSARPDPHMAHLINEIWESCLRLISVMFKRGDEELEGSEPFWLAGFRSHSRMIANTTIKAWNSMMDEAEFVIYPPKLQETLEQLRLAVDIQVPFLSGAGKEQASLSETQDQQLGQDLQSFFPWLTSMESELAYDEELPESKPPSSAPRKSVASRVSTPTPATPRRKLAQAAPHRTPTRLRHNDSQVEFFAVDSSPVDPREVESQMLTERQQEVRRRHNDDAVLFSDINSRPFVKDRPQSLLKPNTGKDGAITEAGATMVQDELDDVLPIEHVEEQNLVAETQAPVVDIDMLDSAAPVNLSDGIMEIEVPGTALSRVQETAVIIEDPELVDTVVATAIEAALEEGVAETALEEGVAEAAASNTILTDVAQTIETHLSEEAVAPTATMENAMHSHSKVAIIKPTVENMVSEEVEVKTNKGNPVSATVKANSMTSIIEDTVESPAGEASTASAQEANIEEDNATETSSRSSSPQSFASSAPQSSMSNLAPDEGPISSEASQTLIGIVNETPKAQSIPETRLRGKTQSFRAVVVDSRPTPTKLTSSLKSNISGTTLATPLRQSAKRASIGKTRSFSGTPNVTTRSASSSFNQEAPPNSTPSRPTRSVKRKLPTDFSPLESDMAGHKGTRSGGRKKSQGRDRSSSPAASQEPSMPSPSSPAPVQERSMPPPSVSTPTPRDPAEVSNALRSSSERLEVDNGNCIEVRPRGLTPPQTSTRLTPHDFTARDTPTVSPAPAFTPLEFSSTTESTLPSSWPGTSERIPTVTGSQPGRGVNRRHLESRAREARAYSLSRAARAQSQSHSLSPSSSVPTPTRFPTANTRPSSLRSAGVKRKRTLPVDDDGADAEDEEDLNPGPPSKRRSPTSMAAEERRLKRASEGLDRHERKLPGSTRKRSSEEVVGKENSDVKNEAAADDDAPITNKSDTGDRAGTSSDDSEPRDFGSGHESPDPFGTRRALSPPQRKNKRDDDANELYDSETDRDTQLAMANSLKEQQQQQRQRQQQQQLQSHDDHDHDHDIDDLQRGHAHAIVTPSSPPVSRARSIIASFRTLIERAGNLILGSQEEPERAELEGLTMQWQRELFRAEGRGKDRDGRQ